MLANYKDIKKRIKEMPQWYDENGTPRYDKFHPDLSPNIYADEVVLLKIACQQCGEEFLVEMNWNKTQLYLKDIPSLSKRIKKKIIHYGDPPNHVETDHAGSTMNCDDLEVIEFWEKDKDYEWKRNKKYEIKIEEKNA